MAQHYYCKSAGSFDLPLTDGTYMTDQLPGNLDTGVFLVAFYDASGNLVTPTAGTITPEGEALSGQWHAPGSGDAVISAASCGESATYVQPVFQGSVIRGRVTFAGISAAGATYARASFWRD